MISTQVLQNFPKTILNFNKNAVVAVCSGGSAGGGGLPGPGGMSGPGGVPGRGGGLVPGGVASKHALRQIPPVDRQTGVKT